VKNKPNSKTKGRQQNRLERKTMKQTTQNSLRMGMVLADMSLAGMAQATTVSVPAASYGWVDFGVNVAGDYEVTASGTWAWGPGDDTTATGNDAQGYAWIYDEFYSGAQKGGLVAYVGASAPANSIVQGSVPPAGKPGYYTIQDGNQSIDFGTGGEIYFVINDDAVTGGWSDNSGSLNVDLTAAPEPTAMTLMTGPGAFGLVWLGWRSRHSANARMGR
jgi:hypothetical protein